MIDQIYYDWKPELMLEVVLKEPDDFLKVRETLTRIGVASRKDKKLYQSCHILHKQGKYYITHFKELFALDGKPSDITLNDVDRRNAIAVLLQDWGLVKLVQNLDVDTSSILSQIKIVSFKEKHEWELVPKYQIGTKVYHKTKGE
jgi:endonuclease III